MSRDRSSYSDDEILQELADFALASGTQGLWELHPTSGRVVVSPGTLALFDLDPGDALPPFLEWATLLHPADRDQVVQLYSDVRAGRLLGRVEIEMRVQQDDGGWRHIAVVGEAVEVDEERDTIWHGVFTDVTEHRHTELELRASEERYRMLVENQGEGIGIVDADEVFVFANPAAHTIFGVPAGRLVGRNLREFVDQEQTHQIENETTKRKAGERSTYEMVLTRPDGERRIILVTATPHTDEDGSYVSALGVFRDITATKLAEEAKARLEEQLRHAQRLESVGRLAAGIAHDFNNLLAPILSLSQLDLGEMGLPENVREDLVTFRKSAERARNLTAQLLAFGRRQVLAVRALEVTAIIHETHTMLRRLIPENVNLELELATEPCVVRADPSQLQQVLINLALNARDAMPDGGTIRICTRLVNVAADAGTQRDDDTGPTHVLLEVTDDGEGMTAEVLERIFEPFFSTKEVGDGSGLGLSTVHGIIEQHGGHIAVDSQLGEGTRFNIYLPRALDAPAVEAPKSIRPPRAPADAVVLLAEDDHGVRRSARRILEHRGFTVLEANDGESALQVAREHQGPIHVLLSDVIMPKLGGVDLAARLSELRPNTAAVFMSGYADDIVQQQGALGERLLFVQKPFTIEALLDCIDEALVRYEDA